MINVAVTHYLLLHTSIYGLHIYTELCGSQQYYNASIMFTHQQVAYELYFIVLFL